MRACLRCGGAVRVALGWRREVRCGRRRWALRCGGGRRWWRILGRGGLRKALGRWQVVDGGLGMAGAEGSKRGWATGRAGVAPCGVGSL